jgi:hypothetical protein
VTNHQPLDPATDETSLAERIRRLEHRCDMEAHHIAELRTQINLLRAERDDARREICQLLAQAPGSRASETYAEERGWQYLNARDAGK